MLLICLLLFVALPLYTVLSGQAPLGRDFRSADVRAPASRRAQRPRRKPSCKSISRARSTGAGFSACTPGSRPNPPTRRSIPSIKSSAGAYIAVYRSGFRAGIPDGRWFGNEPTLSPTCAAKPPPKRSESSRRRGKLPYANEYIVWPGPNSNTFLAYIGRQVPELRMDFPATAIGKDYPINGSIVDRTPSGTGYQLSMLGVLGVALSREEGIEVNLLGLSFGIDFLRRPSSFRLSAALGVGEN